MTPADVLVALGCAPKGRGRFSPCPVCRVSKDGTGRGPVRPSGASIYCNACGWQGSAAATVKRARECSWGDAYRFIGGEPPKGHTVLPADEPPVRPPLDALRRELRTAIPVHRAPALRGFLARRGLPDTIPARWLSRSRLLRPGYPLVAPMWTGRGELASMQGRAIDGRSPKTANPTGYDVRGLLFADPAHARPFLRGGDCPDTLLVVEGLTDYLATAASRRHAVVGIVSGSVDVFRLLQPRLEGCRVVVATDAGAAGDAYSERIAGALYPLPTFRADLRGLAPVVV